MLSINAQTCKKAKRVCVCLCVCVCVCVCVRACVCVCVWFRRTQICIMTWVYSSCHLRVREHEAAVEEPMHHLVRSQNNRFMAPDSGAGIRYY